MALITVSAHMSDIITIVLQLDTIFIMFQQWCMRFVLYILIWFSALKVAISWIDVVQDAISIDWQLIIGATIHYTDKASQVKDGDSISTIYRYCQV